MSGPESNLFVLKSILTTTITKPSSDNSYCLLLQHYRYHRYRYHQQVHYQMECDQLYVLTVLKLDISDIKDEEYYLLQRRTQHQSHRVLNIRYSP